MSEHPHGHWPEPPQPWSSVGRLLPPSLPPAPPGAPSAGGDPPPKGARQVAGPLEESLNDAAVIRTTLETLDLFPGDVDLHGELIPLIEDARRTLLWRLRRLREQITDAPDIEAV